MTPHDADGDSVGGELTVEAAEVFHGDLAVAPDRRDYGVHLHNVHIHSTGATTNCHNTWKYELF